MLVLVNRLVLLKPARAKRPFKRTLVVNPKIKGVEQNPTRRSAPGSYALQLFPERYSCVLQLFPDVPREVHEDHRMASQEARVQSSCAKPVYKALVQKPVYKDRLQSPYTKFACKSPCTKPVCKSPCTELFCESPCAKARVQKPVCKARVKSP